MELLRGIIIFTLSCIAASVATDNQNYFMMNSDRPDQMFKIGSQFHLMCANLKPEKVKNIRWLYRDEVGKDVVLSTNFRGIRVDKLDEERIQLIADEAQKDMGGKYICRGDLQGNGTSGTPRHYDIVRSVNIAVEPYITSPSKQSFIEGEDAEVRCDYQHDAVQDWVRVKEDARFIKEDKKLTIKNVTESDENVYRCQIFNRDTNTLKSLYINVTVNYAPRNVLIEGPSELVQEEDTKEEVLECNAVGKPTPSIVWMVDGKVLENESSNSLVISNPTWKDSGNYKCIAQNLVDKVESDVHILQIKIPPRIYNSSAPSCVENNETFVSAVVEGYPKPDISITFEGSELTNAVTKLTDTTYEIIYEIPACMRNQTGEYTVDVNKDKPDATSETLTLSVTYPPNNMNLTKESCINDIITLSCNVEADPEPHQYNWTKNGSFLGYGLEEKVTILSEDDYTTYTCAAYNAHGVGFVNYDVIRPDVPSPVSELKVIKSTSRKCYLSYEYNGSKDGGFNYNVNYTQKTDGAETLVRWTERNKLELENLKYNSTYDITVQTSKCKLVFSDAVTTTCKTKELSQPDSINITFVNKKEDCDEQLCIKWELENDDIMDEILAITIVYQEIVGKGENKPDKKKLKMDRNTHEQEFKDGFVKIKDDGITSNKVYKWHAIFSNEMGESRSKKQEYTIKKQSGASSGASPVTKPMIISKSPTFVPFVVAALAVVALLADILCCTARQQGLIYLFSTRICGKSTEDSTITKIDEEKVDLEKAESNSDDVEADETDKCEPLIEEPLKEQALIEEETEEVDKIDINERLIEGSEDKDEQLVEVEKENKTEVREIHEENGDIEEKKKLVEEQKPNQN